jgi:hypothetical protein
MAGVRDSITHMLAGHEPYPALVMDGGWNRLLANQGTRALVTDVAPFLLAEPVNVLRLTLHPEGMAPRIANLAEWSEHMLLRLRQRITRQGDEGLAKLYDELASYPGVRAPSAHPAEPGQRVVLPLEYRTDCGSTCCSGWLTRVSAASPWTAAVTAVRMTRAKAMTSTGSPTTSASY